MVLLNVDFASVGGRSGKSIRLFCRNGFGASDSAVSASLSTKRSVVSIFSQVLTSCQFCTLETFQQKQCVQMPPPCVFAITEDVIYRSYCTPLPYDVSRRSFPADMSRACPTARFRTCRKSVRRRNCRSRCGVIRLASCVLRFAMTSCTRCPSGPLKFVVCGTFLQRKLLAVCSSATTVMRRVFCDHGKYYGEARKDSSGCTSSSSRRTR